MGFILETKNSKGEVQAFHWKTYACVDLETGKPLAKLKEDGTPARVQQSILLAHRNETFTSKSCWQVEELAVAKKKQIAEWEKAIVVSGKEPEAPSADITVTEFYEKHYRPWLEEQVTAKRKTHSTLVSTTRYWSTYCADFFNGTKRFSTFEPYMGQQWLENLRKDDGSHYGEATLRHIHAVCSAIFARAILEGFAGKVQTTNAKELKAINPWHAIKASQAPQINAEQGEAFTEKQVSTLLDALTKEKGRKTGSADGRVSSEKWAWDVELARTVIAVGFYAGLRPSEIACLQWQSVNLRTEKITVCRAYVYGRENPETKTGKTRVVPFHHLLTPILQAWWELNEKPESGWCFPNGRDNPVNMNDLSSRVIQPIADRTGTTWAGYTFYALRRGWITTRVLAGWTPLAVAQAAGNSVAIIEKNYFKDDACELASKAREQEALAGGGR
jgi:integrase